MRFRTNLRYRVTLGFALLGLMVSVGLAIGLYVLTIDMEERLIAETLALELEEYITRYQQNPADTPPITSSIRIYVLERRAQHAPRILLQLQAGLHHLQLDGKGYYVEVREVEGRKFVVLYDDRQIRHRENQFKVFLGLGVLSMTLLSALLGYWMAGQVTAPVGELASRVADLAPDVKPESLADDFPHDEVGQLARNFAAYQRRLATFIEREQAFTADVSHELRTPLAVIEGASEVLLDDAGLSPAQRERVDRILRSVHEMSEMVTALLVLAREEKGGISTAGCMVEEALKHILEGQQHLLRHKAIDIKLDIQAQPSLPVECTLLRIVLANLIRNAIYYTEQGQVKIHLEQDGVTVEDTGIGIPAEHQQNIFERFYSTAQGGEGIGLSLVKRICLLYGWVIKISSQEGQGTRICLSFQSGQHVPLTKT